ncbi:DNA methyltransferase [Methylosinus sp. Sm6]|uniref:DNA methyltransferase n=1 Tax=Methylosinus sp. Sm6 TaxID=2866948 RepID=UPI001C99001A|nr:DNA methyltransferase [Methylosinus sp. Sm6]MBY6240187.1 site-specific DNA-methyltransferase [Methylosinus sp. Sm6]
MKASALAGCALEAQLLAFDAFGAPTRRMEEEGVAYLVNEFWTSAQRQAHSIHEISYRACFKPQLPEFFISRLTTPGDAVFDPFMGRGTTPVQAALQGRRPVGADVNPLSILLTRPRLAPPGLDAIERRLSEIPWDKGEIEREDLLVFYHPDTLRRLCALRRHLIEGAAGAAPDPIDDWIRMVAINRLTGHSPGFFSVYSLPPNQAVSVEAQARINEKRRQTPPPRDVAALILRKSRALLADGAPPPHPPALLATSDAWRAPFLREGEVRLVVTSPPFLDVVHYASDNWLRNWFAGVDPGGMRISNHRSEAEWERMARACLAEFARIVAPGGHVAFEVGEVRGGKVLLERLVWRAAEGLPFERLFVLVNSQNFTKTSNCWGVGNNAKGTNTNRVVLLRRL